MIRKDNFILCTSEKSYFSKYEIFVETLQENATVYLFGNIFECLNLCPENIIINIIVYVLNQQYSKLIYIPGDFSIVIKVKNGFYIYNSSTTNHPLYFYKKENEIYVSDDYELLSKKNNIPLSNERLAALCWGGNCLPYAGIHPFQFDAIYYFNENILKVIYTHKLIKTDYSKTSFIDLCEITNKLVEQAVRNLLTDKKIALSLSGGLDSSVLAVCLKKLGANFECYHWTSNLYDPVDEREFANELCEKYSIKLNYIDISDGIINNNGYIDDKFEYYMPYNHGSFYWWKKTVMEAQKKNSTYLFTGLNGDGLFAQPFSLLTTNDFFTGNLKWKLIYFINSYGLPYREQYKMKKNTTTSRSDYEYLWVRKADYFNEEYLLSINEINDDNIFIQKESLKFNVLNKYGIYNINPFVDKKLMEFSSCIPKYFKSIPISGQILQKPLLRYAFHKELPFNIYSRNSKSNFGMLSQMFCKNNKSFIINLLSKNSELLNRGIISDIKILDLFSNDNALFSNSYSIIRTCLIEIWLRQKRGENV